MYYYKNKIQIQCNIKLSIGTYNKLVIEESLNRRFGQKFNW